MIERVQIYWTATKGQEKLKAQREQQKTTVRGEPTLVEMVQIWQKAKVQEKLKVRREQLKLKVQGELKVIELVQLEKVREKGKE